MDRAMSLAALCQDLGQCQTDALITGLTLDSRAVRPGDAFIALDGSHVSGVDYIAQAVSLGASAIIASRAVIVPAGVGVAVIAELLSMMLPAVEVRLTVFAPTEIAPTLMSPSPAVAFDAVKLKFRPVLSVTARFVKSVASSVTVNVVRFAAVKSCVLFPAADVIVRSVRSLAVPPSSDTTCTSKSVPLNTSFAVSTSSSVSVAPPSIVVPAVNVTVPAVVCTSRASPSTASVIDVEADSSTSPEPAFTLAIDNAPVWLTYTPPDPLLALAVKLPLKVTSIAPAPVAPIT